jgi:hypothetical protein
LEAKKNKTYMSVGLLLLCTGLPRPVHHIHCVNDKRERERERGQKAIVSTYTLYFVL